MLALEGLDNVRDVGGLPLEGGGHTRFGVLLRSASLHYLTPADVAHLVDRFGLRLVVDLRTRREVDRDGPTAVARAGVETLWLSLLPEDGEPLPWADGDVDPVLRSYRGYLEQRGANVVAAVRRLAAVDAGPALVHCAAGKDRTGVLVALVLDAVGVRRRAVLADYVASAEHVPALFRRWTAGTGEPMPADLTRHLPRPEVMAAVLAGLDADHGTRRPDGRRSGGAAGWLRANGLGQEALRRLRERLTA